MALTYLSGSRRSRHLAALAAIAILVAGCGGDDSADSGATASNPAGGNTGGTGNTGGNSSGVALAIGGTPPAQVLHGTEFSFVPVVTGAAGLTLNFSGSNLPVWASINHSTGRISGTPGPGHVGVYSNIRVTVSGGGKSATSQPFTVTVVGAAGGSATLSWLAPTQRTDGSPLAGSLAGYKIYAGQSPASLQHAVTIPTPGHLTWVIDNLTSGSWYFATTAYDVNGQESAFSNVASKTIN